MSPSSVAVASVVLTLVGVAMIAPWAATRPQSPVGARWRVAGFGFIPLFVGLFGILLATAAATAERL